jgi:hypothetical protein
VGIDHLPLVELPCDDDFFSLSVRPEDCVLVSGSLYTSLTGSLVHVLQTRDDVRLFVSHLCSKNAAPCEGDYMKAIHLLRYLSSTSHIGRCYRSSSTDIEVFSDAAFFLHSDVGRSSSAYFFCVGSDNAPFHSDARMQSSVATCPMTAEYMGACSACKLIVHLRQLASDLGFPPRGPTRLFLDSQTSINLVVAPEVSRKSRHIPLAYHYIRELTKLGIVIPTYVAGSDMRANVMTKYLPPKQFLRERGSLMNTAAYE